MQQALETVLPESHSNRKLRKNALWETECQSSPFLFVAFISSGPFALSGLRIYRLFVLEPGLLNRYPSLSLMTDSPARKP
ncbi:MAG: hypothetical protein JWO89_727, partial [Verrucomicrobiaceae bacterium]|nr:hypothetical protein [Verrucomicrobiaceae bacterium]